MIDAISGRSMKSIGSALTTVRKTHNGLKHSIGEVKVGISSYIKNTINTRHAVSEGSQDIGKIIGGLPYKVRMLPTSIGSISTLSKKGDALYLSEEIFNSSDFQKQLKASVEKQGLTIDTKKFRVSMDYFGRLQFTSLGGFSNAFLDQFGEGTPTHTALTDAIKNTISEENKNICSQIMLGHILQKNISQNNWNIKGEYEGKSYSFSLQNATKIIMDNTSNEKINIISHLLEEQGSSLSEIKSILNDNISPKDIISRYPDGRKVMDKSLYLHKNNFYSFKVIPEQRNTNTQPSSIKNILPTPINNSNDISHQTITNTTNKEDEINALEQYIDTFNTNEEKLLYIENIILGAPTLAVSNLPFYMKLMSIKTELVSKKQEIPTHIPIFQSQAIAA